MKIQKKKKIQLLNNKNYKQKILISNCHRIICFLLKIQTMKKKFKKKKKKNKIKKI